MNLRRTWCLLGLIVVAAARGLPAQGQGVWLEWSNARLTLYPDSAGVFLWMSIDGARGRSPVFAASFDPARVDEWLTAARALNSQPIDPADTSTVRSVPMLQSIVGDAIRVVRRRDHGQWSKERFIVMESINDTVPLVFSGSEESVGQVLDSIAAVSKRTRFSESAAQLVIGETLTATYDKYASASPKNMPPAYPMGALRAHRSGMVVVSFYVGENGKPEMATARTLFATEGEFASAVMEALPRLVFFPAEKDGKKVRSRVVMPFSFSVIR